MMATQLPAPGSTEAHWSVVDPDLAQAFLEVLEHERRESAELRRRSEIGPIVAFARALEARCADTSGHSDRVGCTSEMLAVKMGVLSSTGELIGLAARLHDIGKVGVPDAILWKPEALTVDELATMMDHSRIGAEMLTSVGLAADIREIVRAHHERWDGSGYPDRLARGGIPLGARIVAVADVYDAMRSPRPYRAALPRERVIEYVVEGRGSHFDPEVVDVFLTIRALEPPEGEGFVPPGRPRKAAEILARGWCS